MPEFFIFLLKVNVALTLFCLAYYLILRKLTFYTLNRFFLLSGIVFSSLCPFIEPKTIFGSNEVLVQPITAALPVIYLNMEASTGFDYWLLAKLVFWMGVAFLICRMILRFTALYKVHQQSTPGTLKDYPVRFLKGDMNTFSFWKNIYLNTELHQPKELEAIVEHEQVHVKQWHTIDILLAELTTIFYWFNPGVWYMKKAIQENVEFITDQKILQNGIDRKAYQYSMVHTLTTGRPTALMNNFNITGIKKRIIMMNSKRSSSFQLIRYVFILPVLLILTSAFTLYKGEKLLASTETLLKKVTIPTEWINNEPKQEQIIAERQPVELNQDLKQEKPVKAKKKQQQPTKQAPAKEKATFQIKAYRNDQVQDTARKEKFKGRVLMLSDGVLTDVSNTKEEKDQRTMTVIRKDGSNSSVVIRPIDSKTKTPINYFLNEEFAVSSDISLLDPNTIESIEIYKDNKGPKLNGVWIYTKGFKKSSKKL